MVPESDSNWLSFSLSSMENPAVDSDTCYSFSDNFCAAEAAAAYMHQSPPKMAEFFAGGDSAGTQDSSSLTHMYFGDEHHPQDLKAVMGPFPASSGISEVDDSPFSAGRNLCPAGTGDIVSVEPVAAAVDSVSCRKTGDAFGPRTSIYRGVTRHRWTGRYEAHLWDSSCRREGQARKGRQVYLGGYDKEDKAAHAYNLAALKYWGPSANTNFPVDSYAKEIDEMANATKQEFIASLRRKSSGFSRGASVYRGVTRHHRQGNWQARIGRVAGNKDLYLGTFSTEEEAAEAYDIAAIKFRGVNAVTNFEMSRYDIEAIDNSPLPVGGASKRLKLSGEAQENNNNKPTTTEIQTTPFSSAAIEPPPPPAAIEYGVLLDSSAPFYNYHHLYNPAAAVSDASPVNSMQGEPFVWPHQSY